MTGTGSLSPADADHAYAAAQVVVETHRRVSDFLRAGLRLPDIDAFIAKQLEDQGARSCFLHYTPQPSRLPPFPSHACLSVNDCVVHGTSGYFPRELRAGDLFKVDIGVWFKGWVGDAAWTYSIGAPEPVAARLMECGKKSLAEGVKELRPGRTYAGWAKTVQRIVEQDYGFHLVRGLGGHGLYDARKRKATLHGPPFVANRMPDYPGEWNEVDQPCAPGTLIAVEPMIGAGTGELRDKPSPRKRSELLGANIVWPELIADGSLSVHYEHDVLITETGPVTLTEGLELTPDVITR